MRRTLRVLATGGLGDAVLATPAVAALRTANPTARLVLYASEPWHRDVFLHNPHVTRIVDLRGRRAALDRLVLRLDRRNCFPLTYGRLRCSLAYHKPAAAIVGEMFEVKAADHPLALYLTDEEMRDAHARLDETPVVALQITSRLSPNENWPVERWAALVRRCPDVHFVQLGLADEPRIAGATDWRGRTSVREACAIVKAAAAFAGVVSGLGHVAAAVGTPAVILFGPSTPVVWGHASAINLFRGLRCAPCIDLLGAAPCPYGAACLTDITVDEVEQAVRAQLRSRTAG